MAQRQHFPALASATPERLGVQRPGVTVLGFAESKALTLIMLETTTATNSVHSGSHEKVEISLAGLLRRKPPESELAMITVVRHGADGDSDDNQLEGRVFRLRSHRKSRYADLPTLRRWQKQAMDSLDFTADEIVAADRAKQSTTDRARDGRT